MTEMIAEKLGYSIKEACVATSLKRTSIYELIRLGKLRAVKVGKRTIIVADSLRQLINTNDPS